MYQLEIMICGKWMMYFRSYRLVMVRAIGEGLRRDFRITKGENLVETFNYQPSR